MQSKIITSGRMDTRTYLSHPSWDDLRAVPVKREVPLTSRFTIETVNYNNPHTLRSLRKAWPTRIFPFINSATLV